MPEQDALVGHTMGEFKILRFIGAGGMGRVYLAEQTSLGREVAVKVLPKQIVEEQSAIQRFEREARLAAQLTHPNIAQVHTIGQYEGHHYVAMELITGGDVALLMKESGRIALDEATAIIRQALLGLAEAHGKDIVHRDIKPQNLMLTSAGIVKITDFGLARALAADSSLTASGAVLGTPLYMSPEQAEGEEVDVRTDIHALGATFYHMICGRPPFQGGTPLSTLLKHLTDPLPSPKELDPDIPDDLCAIIEKLMAKKREERYQTCEEALADLDAYCEARGVPSGRPVRPISPIRPIGPISPPEPDQTDMDAATSPAQSYGQRTTWRDGVAKAQATKRKKPVKMIVGAVAAILVLAVVLFLPSLRRAEEPLPSDTQAKKQEPAASHGVQPEPEVAQPRQGFRIYREWPFDAAEAKRRQQETAKALGIPVEKTIGLPHDVEMTFVLIPAGEFEMGSSDAEIKALLDKHPREEWVQKYVPHEAPRHRVRITRPFYLGKCEVTQSRWEGVAGENPSKFTNLPDSDRRPVETVSWNDAKEKFLAKAKAPKGMRFRLPTEAEWEYACRAGAATAYWFGDDDAELSQHGYHKANSSQPQLAASKGPNPWGLFGMHGNVWEWCEDWHGPEYYSESPTEDPPGAARGSRRILRGGSYYDVTGCLRSAYRHYLRPDGQFWHCGLRVCLDLGSALPSGASATGARPPWAKGCVLAYSFDDDTLYEKAGKRYVRDLSGRGHDGELVGGRTVAGRHGDEGLHLSGRGEHVTLGHVEGLNFTKSQPFTYMAWVRPAGGNDDGRSTIMGKCDGSPGGAKCGDLFQFDVKHGHFIWEGVTDTRKEFDTRTKVGWQPGRWHLAAVTYDGKGLTAGSQLYLNGEPLEMTRARPAEIPGEFRSNADFRLGGRAHKFGGAQYFLGGEIDEAAVWSRALSAQEIKALYDYSKAGRSYCEAIGRAAAIAYTNSLGLKFVKIPAGEFLMGSTAEEIAGLLVEVDGWARTFIASEAPRHPVRIRREFLMGRFEVTRGQYRRFVEASGYVTVAEKQGGTHTDFQGKWQRMADCNWRKPYHEQTDDHPVVCLAFADTQAFCDWLNQHDTKKPKGLEYRLPTEAEWEYAARGPRPAEPALSLGQRLGRHEGQLGRQELRPQG